MDNCWLNPTKVNQGAYNLALLLDSLSTLHVVQLTVVEKHDLKLQYVVELLKTLAEMGCVIKKLEVIIVVPTQIVETFKVGQVLSDKSKPIVALGWNTSMISILGFQRTGIASP